MKQTKKNHIWIHSNFKLGFTMLNLFFHDFKERLT